MAVRVWLAIAALVGCSKSEPDKQPATQPAPKAAPDPFLTFDTTAPTVGQLAPSIELVSTTGERVSLEGASSRGPVVLVFASFTCPPSRMKLPRFEALARRWKDKAQVFVVYSREAHPRAKNSERLNNFADRVQARDKNGDGTITVAEYGDLGPRYMLDAFDLDHDGEVRSHEFLAARRLDQFADVSAPATIEQRMTLAKQLRADSPGQVPVLVDGMDDAIATAYGGLPNMAYVIAQGGKVSLKMPWAAIADIERELARLTGTQVPASEAAPMDLAILRAPLDKAAAVKRPLLVEFTALGCKACERLAAAFAEPEIASELSRYEVVKLGIERDGEWALFESLALVATPSLVVFRGDVVAGSLHGAGDRASLRAFLTTHAAP
jgi:thiol-disulfide isomerase/thioredoxin